MRKVVQVAVSGLSGASDVCAALAIAGEKAGVHQAIAFWGIEPVIEARVKRCVNEGIVTAAFSKKQGLDSAGQRAVQTWVAAHRDADAFILHYPASIFAVRKGLRGAGRRPAIVAIEHHSNLLKRSHEWMLSVLLLWRGDGVIYLTDAYRTEVARRLGPLFWLRKKRTAVIGNGIELERYQVPGLARATGQFVIGMSGRMTAGKDYSTLLKAFAAFRQSRPAADARLELAGDGAMRGELEALAASLGIADAVSFLGLLPFSELVPRMRSWDAFVLSTRGETQPLALMEAMACGLPCIGSAVAGVIDVIHDGRNGILVSGSDTDALAKALRDLADDPARRATLADAALQCARASYSSTRMWENVSGFVGRLRR
jgi:glycosyltransferase involved in cell wall biosynthesis